MIKKTILQKKNKKTKKKIKILKLMKKKKLKIINLFVLNCSLYFHELFLIFSVASLTQILKDPYRYLHFFIVIQNTPPLQS